LFAFLKIIPLKLQTAIRTTKKQIFTIPHRSKDIRIFWALNIIHLIPSLNVLHVQHIPLSSICFEPHRLHFPDEIIILIPTLHAFLSFHILNHEIPLKKHQKESFTLLQRLTQTTKTTLRLNTKIKLTDTENKRQHTKNEQQQPIIKPVEIQREHHIHRTRRKKRLQQHPQPIPHSNRPHTHTQQYPAKPHRPCLR